MPDSHEIPMNVHPLVSRLIELHRAEFLTRLLPHVRRTLVDRQEEIKEAEDKAEKAADAANLDRMLRGFRRVRLLHMANAILDDSVCAVAFGYRLDRSSRKAMIEDVKEGAWQRPTDRSGVPLHTLVLRRADLYLGMISRITEDLGYAKGVKDAVRDAQGAVRFALWPEAPGKPRGSDEEPRRQIDVVRWSVEKAIKGRKGPDGPLNPRQQAVIEDALLNSRRTLVDTTVEAATVVLRDRKIAKLSPAAKAWLCWYLIGETRRHTDKPDCRFADPMTFFRALEEVSAAGMTEEAADVLNGLQLQIAERGADKNEDTLRELLRRRDYRPTKQELPEIGENIRRGSCLALVSLCRLRKDMVRKGIRGGLATIDLLLRHYLENIVRKSSHADKDRPKVLYAGTVPAPGNLYVIALHLWALEQWWKLRKRASRSPSIGSLLVGDDAPSLKQTIQYATEINLEDHRLFGDFLVWNGVDHTLTNMKNDLTRAVDRYFEGSAPRPLNVLITAQPGTGKSFFVKNVLKETGAAEKLHLIEINATQLHRPDDLFAQLRRATSQIADHGKGLLFLDEADTQLPSGDFLFSHLLGPMWDGEYTTDGVTLTMKRVVWFFAVSRESTYEKFAAHLKRKKIAKADDFLSRLYLKYTLPELDDKGNLLVFLGNVRRIHKKVTRMTREVLDFFATHKFQGAREIEKCVLLINTNGNSISLDDIPESYRNGAVKTQESYVPGYMKQELVSLVQL